MSERTLSVLDGSTFVVSDRLGDMRGDEGREHDCELPGGIGRVQLRASGG